MSNSIRPQYRVALAACPLVSSGNQLITPTIKPKQTSMDNPLVFRALLLIVLALGTLTMPNWAHAQDGVSPQTEREVVVDPLTPDEILARAAQQQKWATLVASLTIFVLAVFIGFELITKVPPTLHTPLMSGSNAISGISIVGALLVAAGTESGIAAFFGFIAVILAAVNVVGGYLVTHRMLEMFGGRR